MIGHHVQEDNKEYSVLLDLLDVVQYLLAREFSNGDLFCLQTEIEEFLENLKATFSEKKLKPKAHHLLHYAKEIEVLGPLVNCQTLRFDGKHNYFKELSYRSKNRVTICKTLASRHQQMQSVHHMKENFLEPEPVSSLKGNIQSLLPCFPEAHSLC